MQRIKSSAPEEAEVRHLDAITGTYAAVVLLLALLNAAGYALIATTV